MLHTLSHQWPVPSTPDPITLKVKGCNEVERHRSYFGRIDRSRLGVLIPLIESCLSNLPKNRTSIVTLCEQLEGLVDREHVYCFFYFWLQLCVSRSLQVLETVTMSS